MLMNSERSWDNFWIRRDCFREFSSYFKNEFKPFNQIWQSGKWNKLKKTEMIPLVVEFLKQMLQQSNVDEFVVPALTILHSHWYKKEEDFLEGIDFTVIRNLVQSYSQEAWEEFMANPYFAWLFNHFCLKRTPQVPSISQGKTNANWLYVLEIEKELKSLQAEALMTLRGVF